jgi:uncharacterized protein
MKPRLANLDLDRREKLRRFEHAVIDGDLAALASLLDEGLPIESLALGRPLIHEGVIRKNLAMVELYLSRGGDVNAKDNGGCTALHFAAQEGHVEIATRLLAAGSEVDPTDEHGNTPLSDVVFYAKPGDERWIAVLNVLLEAGADPERANHHGSVPLELAASIEPKSVVFTRDEHGRWRASSASQ